MGVLWFLLTISIAQVSCQELTIDACTRNEVTFTCTIRGSPRLTVLILAWNSTEYIGQDNLLRFTTQDMPRTNVVTSMINRNVTAILTSNTIIGGVPELMSELHIISASQSSVITCASASNGSSESIWFDSSGIPGRPQNLRARKLAASDCGIWVTWDPPTNIDESDIDSYIIYIPSQNITKFSSSPTINLTLPNCGVGNTSIQVAAVNRLGCVGPYSPPIQPILVEMPTTQRQDNRPSSVVATTALVLSVIFSLLLVVAVVLVAIFLYLLYRKVKARISNQDSEAAKQLLKENKSPTDTPLKEMDSKDGDTAMEVTLTAL